MSNQSDSFETLKIAAFNDELEKIAIGGLIGKGLSAIGGRLSAGTSKLLGGVSKATKPMIGPVRAGAEEVSRGAGSLIHRGASGAQGMLHKGYMRGAQALGGPERLNQIIGGTAVGATALGAGSMMSSRRRSLAPQAAYPRY